MDNKKKNIFSSLEKYNNKIAIIDENLGKISYKKLLLDVKKIKKNFKSKELIAIFSENSYEFIVVLIAAIQSNQAVILLNPQISEKDYENLYENYFPHHIFGKKSFFIEKKYRNIFEYKEYSLYQIKKKKILTFLIN